MSGDAPVADAASVGSAGIRVVKVGGSLFDFDGLVPALREWLDRQGPLTTVLVAGGGKFAEAIREADGCFALGEEASHWLCIRAMSVSARLLAALLPEAEFLGPKAQPISQPWVTPREQFANFVQSGPTGQPIVHSDPLALRAENTSRAPVTQGGAALALGWEIGSPLGAEKLCVLDVEHFLRNQEHLLPDPLPHDWSVSSDSIAARLAYALGANELVLLKSAGVEHKTPAAAAAAGYVDPHFPQVAANVARVRWVNLRSGAFEEGIWMQPSAGPNALL